MCSVWIDFYGNGLTNQSIVVQSFEYIWQQPRDSRNFNLVRKHFLESAVTNIFRKNIYIQFISAQSDIIEGILSVDR